MDFEVRSSEPRDLQTVVDLYRSSFPGATPRPRDEVERKLDQLFFDGPLMDPRFPSLVACDDEGTIVGFRGWLCRRWRLREDLFPGRTTTGIMVRADLRRRGISSAMRTVANQFIDREPEHTVGFSDRTSPDGRAFYRGDPQTSGTWFSLEQYGYEWVIPLLRLARPVTRVRGILLGGTSLAPARTAASRLAGALSQLLPARPLPIDEVPELRGLPLSATALGEVFAALEQDYPLRLDEPPETWRWLFDYLTDYPSRGRFAGRVWLGEKGEPVGFYAGYLNDRGQLEVVASRVLRDLEEDGFGVAQILRDGRSLGATSVLGWANARELRPVMRWGARVRPGMRAGANSRRQEIRLLFTSMEALVTGLEGERWI